MDDMPDIAMVAKLLGEPARARMLVALMDGSALTATELSLEADVTASTASSHLARLHEARLLSIARQGRHRYFRLAGPEVAQVLEALMGVASRPRRIRTGPSDAPLRAARLCYDHLAGDRGVRLLSCLKARGHVVGEEHLELTEAGKSFFLRWGLRLTELPKTRRSLCRPCLDWSERRWHLGGTLGAEILRHLQAHRWVRRLPGSRALVFSAEGAAAFSRAFG